MINAPLCALAHLMNALFAGFFELMALFSAIFAFLSSCDIMMFLSIVDSVNSGAKLHFLCDSPKFSVEKVGVGGAGEDYKIMGL